MKLFAPNLLPISLLLIAAVPTALAARNGRCNEIYDGICIDRGQCAKKYKGFSYSQPYCPNDPNNIECCVISECLGKGTQTLCTWRDECTGFWEGTILPDKSKPSEMFFFLFLSRFSGKGMCWGMVRSPSLLLAV